MHFLCLHGVGTNSKILELQTSAIRYALGPQHTYDFVEGALDHPMAPGISNLVSPTDSFHAYFAPTSGHSLRSALRDLDVLIADADPPYDGVWGFSHGACLAATMLARPQQQSITSTITTACATRISARLPAPFRVAVFFSAGMAADHGALQVDEIRMLRVSGGVGGDVAGERTTIGLGDGLIEIPTAHVFADEDEVAPEQGGLLVRLCAATGRHVATHGLGHCIPGAAERESLEAAVEAIRGAIRDAEERTKRGDD
ncbi:serine hydrolase FSH [Aspergillus insuetus]